MGNSQQNGLEENFCKEIDKEDMMMLRIELTTADPSRALNQLGLEAYHMPYYVEENQNQNGHVWKSYHDLVGEIDSSVPASLAWRPDASPDEHGDGEAWHPKRFPLAYGTCMNYAMKLDLPSEPYLKSIMPNLSPYLPDPDPRLCVEVSMDEMMEIRRGLLQRNPSELMKEYRLHADSMPYVVEAGGNYTSYHDLVGEIDPEKPANAGWEPEPWLAGPAWDPQFCAIPYGSIVAYATKLDLPSLPWLRAAFPGSKFLNDKRALKLIAMAKRTAQQKARALEERRRAVKATEQAEVAARMRLQEQRQREAQQERHRTSPQANVDRHASSSTRSSTSPPRYVRRKVTASGGTAAPALPRAAEGPVGPTQRGPGTPQESRMASIIARREQRAQRRREEERKAQQAPPMLLE